MKKRSKEIDKLPDQDVSILKWLGYEVIDGFYFGTDYLFIKKL